LSAELIDQVRWLRQTVHQAHHEGPIEECKKSTCTSARDMLTQAETGKRLPKIFILCNTRCENRGEWHSFIALAEDGTGLAGHLCSSHGWAMHDMGFTSSWKHEKYAKHYPGGYELVWVADPDHPEKIAGLKEAFDMNQRQTEEKERVLT
jgi:hypothetical protein